MDLYIALVHYPVYDKNRRVIATAVTNMDVHDLARLSATVGAKGFFLVTPVEQQRELVGELLKHWTAGYGANYNPRRKQALELASLVPDLADAATEVQRQTGVKPVTIGTAAGDRGESMVTFSRMREIIDTQDGAAIVVFGTGWGLERSFFESLDYSLAPVLGKSEYNHLSVRSAASIVMDRLAGVREE
mgnify:CR=1 FL=1